MSEAKHTPGPWAVYDGKDVDFPGIEAQNGTVVIFGTTRQGDDGGVRGLPGNANLIAAAPELLEILEELATYPEARNYPDGPCIRPEDMEEIKRVIAKATGKESA